LALPGARGKPPGAAVLSRDHVVSAGFLGLGISLFPYIVPPNITIWQAANTVESQRFALYGFALVMPLTFIYTGYAYWVFRGKVAEDITGGGYH
jgi:cytochrome d ubiquinol oxidase subunit II